MQIACYLTFNGNCGEAMAFYKDCFGGQLSIQYLSQTPQGKDLPKKMRSCVLHALLQNDKFVLMGTDIVGEAGLHKGNAISFCIDCKSQRAVEKYYVKLSMGGEAAHPLKVNHWGIMHGELIDKYGHHWILSCKTAKKL